MTHKNAQLYKLIFLWIALVSMLGQGFGQAVLPLSRTTWSSEPTGWSKNGAGSYTSPDCNGGSSSAKYSSTGHYHQVNFNSTPDQLSYVINGNSFSGGTFTIQESANGSSWSTVVSYTSLSGSCNSENYSLSSTSRYVRFYYTSKSSGNVEVDDVNITKGVPPSNPTLTYDGNGNTSGSAPVDSNSPYSSGATVTVLGNSGNLTKTNHVFSGWNTASDGSGTTYTEGETFTISGNTILYAKWTALYSITYDGNGNTGGSTPTDANNPYEDQDDVTVLGNTGSLTKTGFAFNGWNTAVNGSGTDYAPSQTFSISSDITLYAKWIEQYSVTYHGNGNDGGSVPADGNNPYDDGETITILGNTGGLTNGNLFFVGWNTSSDGTGTHYDAGETVTISENIDLYAEWSSGCATDLFISEYVEGSSSNKYIEIYNGTGVTVSLTDYSLRGYQNGSTSVGYTYNLSNCQASLAHGQTLVIGHGSGNIYSEDCTFGLAFNGDDAISLYHSTKGHVDIIGRIGEDPGSSWNSGAHSTENKTLVRESSVTKGISSNPNSGFPTLTTEWDVYSTNDASHLGSHTMTCPGPEINITQNSTDYISGSTFNFGDVVNGGNSQKTFTIENNGDETLTVTSAGITAGSSDFTSDNVNTTIAADGSTTFDVTFEPSALGAISATLTVANDDNDEGTYTITLNGNGTCNNPGSVNSPSTGSITDSQGAISWSGGDGSNTLVIVKAGSAVTATPSEGSTYNANANFGSGADLGTNEFAVYAAASNVNTVVVQNLNANTTYHYAIYEYNTLGCYSTVTTGNFKTECEDPSSQVTSLTISNVTSTGLDISWSKATNSEKTIILIDDATITDAPSDNTTYTGNSNYSSANSLGNAKIIYAADGSSASVTNLYPDTQYYIKAFAYNEGGNSTNCYETTGVSESDHTLCEDPSGSPSSLSIADANATTSLDLSWTKGTGAEYTLVVLKEADAVTATPSDNSSYSASSNFGSGTDIGTGEYVVYAGAGTSVKVTGLKTNTTYHALAYAFNDGGNSSFCYNTTASNADNEKTWCSNPTQASSSLLVSNQTETTFDVDWTGGNGEKHLVVIRKDSAVTSLPTNNQTYSANTTFASGNDLGQLEYVVYSDAGNSVTVTGLTGATHYYISIFDYNFSSSTTCYLAPAATVVGTTACVDPTAETSFIWIDNITPSGATRSATINWNGGNGDSTLVVVREASAVGGSPVDNTSYTANTIFSNATNDIGGGQVVYFDEGSSVAISNLDETQTYHVSIFEFNRGTNNSYCYLTGGSVTSFDFTCAEAIEGSGIDAVRSGENEITVSWTNPGSCFDLVYLVAHPNESISAAPTQNSYSANSNFRYGETFENTNAHVVYSGNGTSAVITGLEDGETYFFKLFSRLNILNDYSDGIETSISASALLCPTLFISQIKQDNNPGLEGTPVPTYVDNSCIEIYNGTGSTVDLSDYYIVVYNNSTNLESEISLSGNLVNNDTYVLCNPNSDAATYGSIRATNNDPDIINLSLTNENAVMLKLTATDEIVDAIGDNDESSSPYNDLCTGDERSLIRNKCIDINDFDTDPSDDFTYESNEWLCATENTNEGLGEHTSACNVTRYYSVSTGNLSNNVWSTNFDGSSPAAVSDYTNSVLTILPGHNITNDQDNLNLYGLSVRETGNVTFSNNRITLDSDLYIEDTLTINSGGLAFNDGCFSPQIDGILVIDTLTMNLSHKDSSLTINNGVHINRVLDLKTGALITNDSLRLKSIDASNQTRVTARLAEIDASKVSITGKATVENCIPDGKTNYRMLASQVTGATITDWHNDFITSGFPGSHYPWWPSVANRFKSITYYDTADETFEAPADVSESIPAGRGYWIWCGDAEQGTNAFVTDVEGTLTTGDVDLTIVAGGNGWNLLGNPYASPIDFDAFKTNDINHIFYVYNPQSGTMDDWNETSDLSSKGGLNGNIASGQAFWVKANNGGTLTISESDKTTEQSGALMETFISNKALLTIKVKGTRNSFYDRVILGWNENAYVDFDAYDTPKSVFGNYYAPRLGLVNSLNNLITVDFQPAPENNIEIPLHIWSNLNDNLTLEIQPNEAFLSTSCAAIVDTINNITYPIKSAFDILTSVKASELNNTFVIKTLGVAKEHITKPLCYGDNNGSITITPPTNEQWQVSLINSTGDTLLQQQSNNKQAIEFNNLQAGMYTVTLTNTFWGNKTLNIEVIEPNPVVVEATPHHETCYGSRDGSIEAKLFGGNEIFNWYINNIEQPNLVAQNLGAGTYQIHATDKNKCMSATQTVHIHEGEQIVFAIDYSSEIVEENETVVFEYFGQAVDSVIWNFGNNQTDIGTKVFHAYENEGIYHVNCTAVKNRCKAEHAPIEIEVIKTSGITSENDVTDIYPQVSYNNQLLNFLNVATNAGNQHISIISIDGKTVFKTNNKSNADQFSINIPKLSQGQYIVKLKNNKQTHSHQLFID